MARPRHNRAYLVTDALVSDRAWCGAKVNAWGTLMTTIHAVMLGEMLALTPSFALLAI
jgi:hypothetical protein